MLNLAHTAEICSVIAPEPAFGIWVQGCSIRCAGCNATSLWPFEKRTRVSVSDLVEKIGSVPVKGVAILGGEPLDQSDAVAELVRRLHFKDYGITLYTGYSEQEALKSYAWIKTMVDLLISGPFEQSTSDTDKPFVGSDNQVARCLSKRYGEIIENISRGAEIHLCEDGSFEIYGYPESKLLHCIKGDIK
jgi:anaerobic ribonucleoside-triphosphate reductase activating protein